MKRDRGPKGTVKLGRGWLPSRSETELWTGMTVCSDPRYAGYRYPAEIVATAVWLYFRFPLSLRMAEGMLAARGITVSHETVRQWGLKFGRDIADRLRRRAPRRGDK